MSRNSLMPVILGMEPANKVTVCGVTKYFPKELNVTIEIPTYLPDGTKPGDPVPDDVGTKGTLAWLVFRTPESVDSFTNLLQQGKELVFGKEKQQEKIRCCRNCKHKGELDPRMLSYFCRDRLEYICNLDYKCERWERDEHTR